MSWANDIVSNMTVDPLFSLLIGAFGASLVGLLGAMVQSKREHTKWLRAQRLDAYGRFMADMGEWRFLLEHAASRRRAEENDELGTVRARVLASGDAVSLLGPKSVNAAGQRWLWATSGLISEETPAARESWDRTRWQFLVEAGKVLNSRNVGIAPLPRDDTARDGQ